MKLLQGNGGQEKINGLAHEWVGSSVTTADTTWVDNKSGFTIDYSNAFTNDGLGGISVTATGGSLSNDNGVLRSPQESQVALFSRSCSFNANNNNSFIGDSTVGVGIDIQRNLGFLTLDATNYSTIPGFLTTFASADLSIFLLLVVNTGDVTKYVYDSSGVLLETVKGVVTNTVDSFDLSSNQSVFLQSNSVDLKTKSILIHYFNSMPADLPAGLSWQSSNPTLGGYPSWREL